MVAVTRRTVVILGPRPARRHAGRGRSRPMVWWRWGPGPIVSVPPVPAERGRPRPARARAPGSGEDHRDGPDGRPRSRPSRPGEVGAEVQVPTPRRAPRRPREPWWGVTERLESASDGRGERRSLPAG